MVKRTVEFEGTQYSVRSVKTEIPDLQSMSRLHALAWLCQNTIARGYQRQANPLSGIGGAISISH